MVMACFAKQVMAQRPITTERRLALLTLPKWRGPLPHKGPHDEAPVWSGDRSKGERKAWPRAFIVVFHGKSKAGRKIA